jgi:peptidoglycan hydrolase CwlO-like protein
MTTIILTILMIGLVIDGILNMRQAKHIDGMDARIDSLASQQRKDISGLSKQIEKINFQLSELSNPRGPQIGEELLQRISATEQSINNLMADLDRSIGTIDQVQQRIVEIEVGFQNAIEELRQSR